MHKSPDAFKTISEVAEELDLPQHVLRFWETRFTQIKLLKRGGGRRYYRPDDVDLLRGIRHFLYGEGYTIKGLQRILKEEGIAFVQAVGRGDVIPSAVPQPVIPDVMTVPAVAATSLEEQDFEQTIPASFPVEQKSGQGNLFAVSAAADSGRFSTHKIKLLKSVLEELRECERVLSGLKIM